MMGIDATVISLGAGVQSSTMLLMADKGLIPGPKPTHAIFADTKAEPKRVYEHLDWLHEVVQDITILVVDNGRSLAEDVWEGVQHNGKEHIAIPAFFKKANRGRGMAERQCTRNYKVRPIENAIRTQILGLPKGAKATGFKVVEWLGISTDEISRMKDSQYQWLDVRYPLIELDMSRNDCLAWFREYYPDHELPRSACTFCPFHTNREWDHLRRTDADGYEFAVALDERMRTMNRERALMDGVPYLHTSLQPLEKAMAAYDMQGRLFPDTGDDHADECAGVCFV